MTWAMTKQRPAGREVKATTLCVVLLLLVCAPYGVSQVSAADLVAVSLKAEIAQRSIPDHYSSLAEERSTRTGGHLWLEKVVEVERGSVRRLISVDGRRLTAQEAQREDERIAKLITHSNESRKADADRKADRAMGDSMLRVMTHAFLYSYDGQSDGCTRIRFIPNPAFQPATYQERILHALEGTILVTQEDKRISAFDAEVSHPVEIGFGLLGKLERNGSVHISRKQIADGTWRLSVIHLHLSGHILVLNSISQDHDESRIEIREVPANLTLAQAAELTRP
jgi:hypothetical protein